MKILRIRISRTTAAYCPSSLISVDLAGFVVSMRISLMADCDKEKSVTPGYLGVTSPAAGLVLRKRQGAFGLSGVAFTCALALIFMLTLGFACPAFGATPDVAAQAAERLRAVAGTSESVTFWSGTAAEHPSYTWTFEGHDLSREQAMSLTSLELGITVTATDTDGSGAPDALILSFASKEPLLSPATVAVALPEGFESTGNLSLFGLDATGSVLSELQRGLTVNAGYASFVIINRSTLALSAKDLGLLASSVSSVGEDEAGFDAGATSPDTERTTHIEPSVLPSGSSVGQLSALSPSVLISITVVLLGALLAALYVHRRRRAELAVMQKSWQSSELVFEDIPSLGELMDIEIEEPRR
jgi:hypothetical protein